MRKDLVTKARNVIMPIINKCTICRKQKGFFYDYSKLGPLFEVHVICDFPYAAIGIDYAGFVFVKKVYYKNNKNPYKSRTVAYCISRNPNSDNISDCTGRLCIEVLKRFLSNFGAPKLIISSNASSFIQKAKEFTSSKGI